MELKNPNHYPFPERKSPSAKEIITGEIKRNIDLLRKAKEQKANPLKVANLGKDGIQEHKKVGDVIELSTVPLNRSAKAGNQSY